MFTQHHKFSSSVFWKLLQFLPLSVEPIISLFVLQVYLKPDFLNYRHRVCESALPSSYCPSWRCSRSALCPINLLLQPSTGFLFLKHLLVNEPFSSLDHLWLSLLGPLLSRSVTYFNLVQRTLCPSPSWSNPNLLIQVLQQKKKNK